MKKFLNHLLVCCFTLFSLSLTAQPPLTDGTIIFLQNCGNNEFLTGGADPTTSNAAGPVNTQWTITANSNGGFNIDSQIPTAPGTGVLRATGTGDVIGTNFSPGSAGSDGADKRWTITYDATAMTYRFQRVGNSRHLYANAAGTPVTSENANATDLNSVWKAIPVSSPPPVPSTVVTLQNCGTGEFLTAAASGINVTMSAAAGTPATEWTYELNANGLYNIDSQLPSTDSGRGILRAKGTGEVVSTNFSPTRTDNDKSWTIEYNAANDTYRFKNGTRYLYDNPTTGTVTATSNIPAVDLNSVWKAVPLNTNPTAANVPTMGEWGLFILFLLLVTVSALVEMSPKMATSNGQTVYTGINFQEVPFDKITFLKAWGLTVVFAVAVFASAMNLFGYELTSADPIGSIVASAIIAYLFMLLKNHR